MDSFVVDSSVVIKWLREEGEESVEEARRYLRELKNGRVQVSVPSVLYNEIVNVAVWDKHSLEITWRAGLTALFGLPLQVFPMDLLFCLEVYELARELGLSGFDASYLVLAKRLNVKLLTADRKLIEKGGELVVPLADFV
ncbi:MAG: hypothetical protein UY21_C0013G0005 [Microgenomates group bacterium GW2011_GWA1_48_10]|uniref:PIN domain-containing protein n=1 Tax=Candidatus Gottesmanbacteria bacterium RIFCSPHIGHO2_01_FULL_47_48 TaxID=1798381 RepID=A0A1F6A5P0_9BACT|nr:MAG: hypothetical protein UY21_C0013G0005 [Microgenomates group bacterium GW2011_GWA1_48_10]OGG19597.1 MAG: hypothetical protein A2721_02900 [Candidatus Gottesmanbacteria bacterium RIFCSPHIGHO2_01_FULL_47_48]